LRIRRCLFMLELCALRMCLRSCHGACYRYCTVTLASCLMPAFTVNLLVHYQALESPHSVCFLINVWSMDRFFAAVRLMFRESPHDIVTSWHTLHARTKVVGQHARCGSLRGNTQGGAGSKGPRMRLAKLGCCLAPIHRPLWRLHEPHGPCPRCCLPA